MHTLYRQITNARNAFDKTASGNSAESRGDPEIVKMWVMLSPKNPSKNYFVNSTF